MKVEDGNIHMTMSPEQNEGMLTIEYLEAAAKEAGINHAPAEVIPFPGATGTTAETEEQKIAELMKEQQQSIVKDAESINYMYGVRLTDEQARYLESKKKGRLVSPVTTAIRFLFDDVLQFPTNEPRPAITMMDIQRQAGRIGGSVFGKDSYFWFSPEATNTAHKGEFIYMQTSGDTVVSHIHYPLAIDSYTGEASVKKFVSKDLTSNDTASTVDMMPNQHTDLDRDELQNLAIATDTVATMLASEWEIDVRNSIQSTTQSVGQVINPPEFNPQEHYQSEEFQKAA